MSYTRKIRALGFARPALGSPDRIKFPPLQHPEKHIAGVHGNAMHIPPPKMIVDRIIPSRTRSESLAEHSDLIIKDKERQMREILGREGQLKKQIISLQKQIQERTEESSHKDDMVKLYLSKEEELINQETYWKEKYHAEVDRHESTKNSLKNEQQKVEDLKVAMETQKTHHAKLVEMHEKEYAEMELTKNQEIQVKDAKLKRLKSQIADTLQGNSKERQRQIDDLSKELLHAQEEADALRIKLKMLSKTSGGQPNTSSCQNCRKLSSKVRELEKQL